MIGQRVVRGLGLLLVLVCSALLASLAFPWRGLPSAAWLVLVFVVGGSFVSWLAVDVFGGDRL